MFPDYLDFSIYRILWTLCILLWLIITPIWILVMKKALETIDPRFRKMNPGETWLTMIPLFQFYWQFTVTNAVANGLREEFLARGIIPKEAKPGSAVGMTANIFFCTALIPVFGIVFALISYIQRIIHLFRIKSYTEQLQTIINVQSAYVATDTPQFDWNEYRERAEEATAQIENKNPERFMPPMKEDAVDDEERWRKK